MIDQGCQTNFDEPEEEDSAAIAVFDALRAACRVQLADYMVPQHFLSIDEIPLSSNGKVMREKLPKPSSGADSNAFNDASADGVSGVGAELTEREAIFVSIWSTVLNIPATSLNVNTNFFSVGGDSLRSLQVVAQARKQSLFITVPQIFAHPTIQSILENLNPESVDGVRLIQNDGKTTLYNGRTDVDISWLKDESEELPEPGVLAREVMEELEGALEELREIMEELGEEVEV